MPVAPREQGIIIPDSLGASLQGFFKPEQTTFDREPTGLVPSLGLRLRTALVRSFDFFIPQPSLTDEDVVSLERLFWEHLSDRKAQIDGIITRSPEGHPPLANTLADSLGGEVEAVETNPYLGRGGKPTLFGPALIAIAHLVRALDIGIAYPKGWPHLHSREINSHLKAAVNSLMTETDYKNAAYNRIARVVSTQT